MPRRICTGRGIVGGHWGHDNDIRKAEPPRGFETVKTMRHPSYYCSKCRQAATNRARWTGIRQHKQQAP